ncbi:putative aldouronate transport system substrate-binding protein [Paenibacillus sp. V4I3]|uniref:ABC transporter substrate-binding protein n=1 Tax=Paenibacillus sp. V4I3 TaxID=3042305 RepID=UPI002789B43F|nr:ABC transporter substrate-binding protein [Paenibacillus sp. V4I3]MDQ0878518.1 putative aldouronate transport system substrate-binding protein [Paenibacillus sp. V4I3]
MKKNLGSISLVSLLALSMVAAGCGKESTTSTPAPAASAAATTATTKANEPTAEIQLMFPGTPQKDVALVEAEANKYLKDKLNVTLKINAVDWGQWDNKLNLMIASGEPSDIVFTAAWQRYAINVAKGAFLDLGPLIDKDAPELKKELDPAFFEGSKINGKNYGIPTNKELAATRGVVYRQDLADKYQLDVSKVKTWADLEPLLKAIKEKEPTITPFFMAATSNGVFDGLDWDYLGDGAIPGVISKTDKSTKVLNQLETPQYVDVMKLTRSWYKAGYINKDASTSTVTVADQAKAGKVFMWAEGLKPGKAAEMEGYVGFKLGQIDLTVPTITTGDASGAMLAISKSSKNPDKAMKVIGLLHNDKYLNNLINFGIEGKHYVKKSDNVIDTAPGIDPKNHPYNPGAQWELGNQFLNYLMSNENPKKWDLFKEFNAKGIKSPGLGFSFDAEPVKTEIAAVTNVSKQYEAAIRTGSVDPDEKIAEYLAKQKAAGVDKIIAEKQKQFDAFLAANKK